MKNPYANSKEQIRHKINTNLRLFVNRLHANFPAHWHTDIEIIWPKDAPYKVICGTQTYYVEVGDILIICPAILHEIFSLSPGARMYIQADFSGFAAIKEIDKAFHQMSPALHIKKSTCPPDVYEKLCNYLESSMKLYFGSIPALGAPNGQGDSEEDHISLTELEPYDELEIYSILMQFIAFCGKNINLFRESSGTSASSVAQKNNVSLRNTCDYIHEHFSEEITLESISAYSGFSKYHFERIFSEYTGMTFYQYLQQIRINYAQTLLSNPELSITDISYQSGFVSCTAFTRAFKKSTGYPPSQFRMLNETQHPIKINPYYEEYPLAGEVNLPGYNKNKE